MELPTELIEKIKGNAEKGNLSPKSVPTEQHKNNIGNIYHHRLDPFIPNEDYSEPITPENDKVDRSNELWEKSRKEKREKFNSTFDKLWKATTGKYVSEVPMLPEEDALHTMNTKLEQGNQNEQKKTGLSEKEVQDLISGFIKDLEKDNARGPETSPEEREKALQAIKDIVNEFQLPVVIQEKETPKEKVEPENEKIEPELFDQKVEEYALDFLKNKALYTALRIENGNFRDFAYGIFTQTLKRELNDFGIPVEHVIVTSEENKGQLVKVTFKNGYSLLLYKKEYFPSTGMTEKESRAKLEQLMYSLLPIAAKNALSDLEDQENFILANENRKIKDSKIKNKNTPEKRTPKREEKDPIIALGKKLSTDEFILLNKTAKTPSYGKESYAFLVDQAKKREKGEEYLKELDKIIDKISPQK